MKQTRARGLRRWSAGGTVLAAAIALVGCGSEDGSTGAAEETAGETAAETAAASPTGEDVTPFCEAAVEAESILGQGPPVDFETASPEEIQAALAEFSTQVEPALAEAEETAPEEVSEPVGVQAGMIREALETGEDSIFEDPEFAAADDAIDEYMLAECGYEQLKVTGVDFEYEGIPDSVPAGTVAVTFDNEGEELHEIGMVRVNDGVTQSVEEIAALPEEEAMSMVTFTGAAFAAPGESDTVFLTLEPGRYGAACFIPEGTTGDTEGEGAPHFTLGMLAEFTVE